MRFFAVAAVLVASASSASAVLYGCFPRTALNIATLNNTSPTQYAGPCSGLCGQERKPVTILADGTKVGTALSFMASLLTRFLSIIVLLCARTPARP
jgi:hypothetical protein